MYIIVIVFFNNVEAKLRLSLAKKHTLREHVL